MNDTAVTGTEMKALDAATINLHHVPSLVLMERAALASIEVLHDEHFDLSDVAVFCGPGNNGGDGIAIARLLHLSRVPVRVIMIGEPARRTQETLTQLKIAESYGVPFADPADLGSTTIIDAILGIGAVRAPTGTFLDAIEAMNSHRQRARILAIDIPSGVSADTGEVPGAVVQAEITVTFAYTKVGLIRPPGSQYAGRVIVKDIGIYHQ